MYHNLLNITNHISKFFTKSEEEKILASEQNEIHKLGLTVEDDAFFEQCKEEFEQQAVIAFSFREATILSQTKDLLEPDEFAELEEKYSKANLDAKERMLAQMEQRLEDDKIENMVEMELNNYLKKFEQTEEFEESHMDVDTAEDDSNYMSGENDIDLEDYIVSLETENELYNEARG